MINGVRSLQPQTKTVMFFALMGIIAGIISAIVRNGWGALFIAIIVYFLSAPLAVRFFKLQQSEFPISKILSSGFGPFFMIWLISWIWLYSALL